MHNKQFKLKTTLIFLLPAIALLYFSSSFVLSGYEKRSQASAFKLSTKVTSVLNELIHSIQIERGLTSGYIVSKDNSSLKEALLKRYKATDKAKNKFLYLIRMTSKDKDILQKLVRYKAKPIFKQIIRQLFEIQNIRNATLDASISFEDEIGYYTKLNKNLINSINIFTSLFQDTKYDASSITQLQELKEYAGLERAYTYYLLVSAEHNHKYLNKIVNLQLKQAKLKERFLLDSSLNTTDTYHKASNLELENQLSKVRKEFLENNTVSLNSKEWFSLISQQIEIYNQVTITILKQYYNYVDTNYKKSLSSLYISTILWTLALFALVILFLLLKQLMRNEEKFIHELDTTKNMYQLLSQINDAMIHIDTISELYTYFAKILYENSNSKLIWIGLVDEDEKNVNHEACAAQTLHKNFCLNFKLDRRKYSILSLAAKSILDKSILFADQNEIKNRPEYNNLSIFNSIQSVAAFPINNENNIIGNVVIFSDKQNAFDGEYISVVERIIDELSFAISKISTQDKRKKDLEELRISSYAFDAQEAMTITDIDGTIIKVNKSFCEITGYTEDEVLGQNPNLLQSSMHDNDFYKQMWTELLQNGSWNGEIYNKRKNGEIFPEILSITAIKDEGNITTNYIAQFIDISIVKQAQEEAEYQADHDFLTGLLNRKALMSRLKEEFAKASRHDFLHAFLFIDLDNFKHINDTHGHNVGDTIIMDVAQRLEYIIREEDILARISGDEFAIMFLNLDKDESEAIIDVKKICNKIISTISDTFFVDDLEINITSSIGINFFPDGEKNIDDVMIHADKAMYQAKEKGKNQFVFFDDALELELKQHMEMEQEIKQAFIYDEFEFYFQPKLGTSTERITGAELLIRWNHPRNGLVMPDTFLPIVNNIGVIHSITKLALECAAKFLKENAKIFDGILSINVSSDELLHQNFEKETIDFLTTNKIEASKIEFEITETDIINDFEVIIKKIHNLQKVGIKFSIDDFGTGYSSLTYLQKLPVNTLKIDKEFFKNLHLDSNKNLVKLMSDMATTFNMHTIAEGIETQEQLDFIKSIGTEQFQGYYFSRAVQASRFVELLKMQS